MYKNNSYAEDDKIDTIMTVLHIMYIKSSLFVREEHTNILFYILAE